MRYRKRPVVVDAMYFTGGNYVAIRKWQTTFGDKEGFWCVQMSDPRVAEGVYAEVYDKLHDTWVGVKPHSWIIRGIQGEYYPCAEDVFEETYERVEEDENEALDNYLRSGIISVDEARERLNKSKW